MANTAELVDTSQNGRDESGTTNGDSDRLEYSGLSEENLGASDAKDSIAKGIVQDFSEDFDEHSAPAPSVKAVRRELNESHAFSDDEFPKTLTTLETVRKSSAASEPAQNVEEEAYPVEPIAQSEDEFEEEPILLEVYNADDEHKDNESAELPVPPQPKKAITYETGRRERKQQFNVLTSDVGGSRKLQTPKLPKLAGKKTANQNNDSIITPNKPIPTQSPEGDDNGCVNENAAVVEHYELSLASSTVAAACNTNGGAGKTEQSMTLTAEEEREIAMEQIMSLPKKKKGRPKLNQALKAAREETKLSKKKKNTLVNSLVSDWDEGETKHDDTSETEIVVEIRPQKKQAIVEPVPQSTFRRSRIIKKKIIWDPDAPETYLNYASLAHTSGAGPVKRPRKSTTKPPKLEPEPEPFIDDIVADVIEAEIQLADDADTVIPAPKKKKTSEIDKLLGDEGAANMLNSLHQGNNNNNKVDGASPAKIPRTKSTKNDACNVQNALNVTPKMKATKSSSSAASSKEVKESSPQKQQNQQANTNNKKTATPKNLAAGKKRGPKTSGDSWDYIYKSRPDDCMIIRRRSNSSYSSTASLNRMSMDLPNAPFGDFDGGENEHQEVEMPNSKRQRSAKTKNFEFAKPKARKIGKADNNDAKYSNSFDEAKSSVDEVNNVFVNHKPNRSAAQSDEIDFTAFPIKLENGNDKDAVYTQISLCRFEKFTRIILHTDADDSKCLLTVQAMKEIESALHAAENDKNCKLVLLTSDGKSFCNGIDYQTLVQSSSEKRRLSAIELSKKLSNFVQMLAAFKKPLVAYVNGLVNGLGTRILPLFDIVWANDSATFNGNDIIEGTAVIAITEKIHYNAKAKLLYLNEVMSADEAKDNNVVMHVLKRDRAEQRVLIECNKLATKSILTLETSRLIQQHSMLPKLKDSLKIEQKQLLMQWTKSDFVDKINER